MNKRHVATALLIGLIAGVFGIAAMPLTPEASNPTGAMYAEWEYTSVAPDDEKFLDEFKEKGKKGWEFAGTLVLDDQPYAIFKRAKARGK